MHEEITKFLKPHKGNLDALYDWSFNEDIPKKRFGITAQGKTWTQKTRDLKSKLVDRATSANSDELTKIADYFIRDWGGIRRFTRSAETVRQFKVIAGYKKIPENLDFPYKSISSWSKWASLICPSWACIYDARVAYSLNAINYLSGASYKIFPIPDGRNTKLRMLDVTTLLLSSKITASDENKPDSLRKKYFVSQAEVYRKYLQTVNEVSKQLWNDENHVHDVEMILFAIADSIAYEALFDFVAKHNKHNAA